MSTPPTGKPKTILVVEDNEDVRELVGVMLREAGYQVREAENGRDALDQLEAMLEPPSLVLLDLMMPVMSGPELLRVLRSRGHLAGLPIVVLSAGGEPEHAPGACRFLRKPADRKCVLAAVREACGAP